MLNFSFTEAQLKLDSTVGSSACGLAPDVYWLIVFRIVQGIGGALMIPGSLSLLSASIDEWETVTKDVNFPKGN